MAGMKSHIDLLFLLPLASVHPTVSGSCAGTDQSAQRPGAMVNPLVPIPSKDVLLGL